jgi:NAD(P)-dependent dehydrogenase (short-subunit alcohol dehydrogenase family)
MLAGKRVIVTAGASGIGAVTAQTCAEAGAAVAICDIDRAALEAFTEQHPSIATHQCDVSDTNAVEDFVSAAIGALGGVDILVNNAGTAGPTALTEDISPADWDAAVTVNLSAQFYFARLIIPYLKAQRSGSIVNMSSAAGRLGLPMRAPYTAAKWGVIGLTQTLAMELGAHDIRVNAILPGAVTGARMDRVLRDKAETLGIDLKDVEADEIKNVSMKRMIEPQEVADLIVFICSDNGRSISGQSLGVCGNLETLR